MQKFNHRDFLRSDIPLYEQILRARNIEPTIVETFIPPTGVIVLFEEKPICLGFMIKCDNKMVINSDLISDPSYPKELRNEAVQYLRDVLEFEARKEGYYLISAFTRHKNLEKKLLTLGFNEFDQGLTHLGRFIWP